MPPIISSEPANALFDLTLLFSLILRRFAGHFGLKVEDKPKCLTGNNKKFSRNLSFPVYLAFGKFG
jgi:hypothetical protein